MGVQVWALVSVTVSFVFFCLLARLESGGMGRVENSSGVLRLSDGEMMAVP